MPTHQRQGHRGLRAHPRVLGRHMQSWYKSTENRGPLDVTKEGDSIENVDLRVDGLEDDEEKTGAEEEYEEEDYEEDEKEEAYQLPQSPSGAGEYTQEQVSGTDPSSTVTNASPASAHAAPPTITSSSSGGISEGTEHLLIAVGSIIGTIILFAGIFVVYRLRRGVPASEIFKFSSSRRWPTERERLPSTDFTRDEKQVGGYDNPQHTEPTGAIHAVDFGAAHDQSVIAHPKPTANRNRNGAPVKTLGDTLTSQRKDPFADPPHESDLPLRQSEEESKSLPQPPDDIHQQYSYMKHKSSYTFADGLTPLPHASFMLGPRPKDDPDNSRFSWSTYREPPTPSNINDSRLSTASTVPRFRTVASWVQSQQGRYASEHDIEEAVPEVPKEYQQSAPAPNGNDSR